MKKIILIGALVVVRIFADESAETNVEIHPIAVFQQEIMRAVELLNTTNFAQAGETPKEAVSRVAADLLNSDNGSSGQMLFQLAIAYVNEQESHGYTKKLITIRTLLGYGLVEMEPEEIVNAIAAHYEQVKAGRLKKSIEHILDMATIRESRKPPNFQPLTGYLESHKDNPSKHLARYMFKLEPDQALVEVERVYAPKSAQLYFQDDSTRSIRVVAAGGHWWEELYAAEKMKQNPKLRDPELIKQLKKSEHAIVRETIQEIEDEKK